MFSARDQNVLSFSHLAHYFLAIFSKVHEFVQNNVFCPTSARFVSFGLATPLFSDFQQSAQFVQNSIFCPRSECFVILALRTPLFSFFQKSALVCTKQRFQHKISTFCHFLTGRTTFNKVHEFVQNSVFSPRSARFVIFALGVPLFTLFSKAHQFVQSSLFTRDKNVLSFSHLAHYF